ncbi:hypothetical protein LTR16_002580 [Cryomyces antarcticus]|uniref:mRNA export factor GLE1 n=1 Tax=Cryomyces antarcticus TaxID=329879 RepID=A0ABR0M9Y0_9PEZI|nr:hypothetical protein LTR60_003705 [Cryomyces antarcticus]KAK5290522.1 hypothetical protein LTR16_002580 [Cryomyces antarcticus]
MNSSPWRQSPSRQLLSEGRRRPSYGKNPNSPRRDPIDSPSRRSLEDAFSRILVVSDRNFKEKLDQGEAAQKEAHLQALAQAAAEHHKVRQGAERAAERYQLELEKERKRREDEEKRDLDRIRQEKADLEISQRRRQIEEIKKAEAEQRRLANETKQLADAEAQLRAQKQRDEAEAAKRKEKEESDRKAREDAAAVEQSKTLQKPHHSPEPKLVAQQPHTSQSPFAQASTSNGMPSTPQAQGPRQPSSAAQPPSPLVSSMTEREATHQRYLHLHQRLKEVRKYVLAEIKKDPNTKESVSWMRRDIRSNMGKLTGAKGANTIPLRAIIAILEKAANAPNQPMVDMTPFFISVSPPRESGASNLGPGILLFLLNIFAKSVVAQFMSEAGVNTSAADPIGVAAVTIFAQPALKWQGTHSLIDILLAKFHFVCPVLWGIYGDQTKQGGRKRIGWGKIDGQWVSEQQHNDNTTGLAAGFAALALRDFTKSKNVNPFPNYHYWHALACIVNTPPLEAQPTHSVALKAMIEGYVPRFLQMYGQAGLVALRTALVEFPARVEAARAQNSGPEGVGKKDVTTQALMGVKELLKRDLKLTL